MVTMIVDGQQLRNSLLSSKPNSRIAVQRHLERGKEGGMFIGWGLEGCFVVYLEVTKTKDGAWEPLTK
jgi:hypothetical protein